MSTFRVVQVSKVRLNPYVRLLQNALLEAGVPCSTIEQLGPRSLPPGEGLRAIVHLHWLELQYTSATWIRSLHKLAAVISGLVLVKLKGGKVVYTVHNLVPHEQRFPHLSAWASRVLFVLADAVHVHDENAAASIAQLLGDGRAGKIHVVVHASYVGAYPNDCSRQQARARIGLSEDAFVYLCLGQIRRYKGIEDLIAAFHQLPASDCELVLAGHVHDPAYAQHLSELTHGEERIHTCFGYVEDSELQYLMNACDVCVLPYRDVTTSGAAILAFSFGKPIIAPALGGFPELVRDGRGIVYDPRQADSLLHALQQSRTGDMASAGERALAWAREHDWRALATQFVQIYQSTLGHSVPSLEREPSGHSPSGGRGDAG